MSSVCENKQLVFFDLDTTGVYNTHEVLGIAAKSDSYEFRTYIMPSKPIPKKASKINKLTVRDGELWYRDADTLLTVPRRQALKALLQFLRKFEYPCVLIAHYWPFHGSFLMPMIFEENLQGEFEKVIAGCTDTLAMFQVKFPIRRYVPGALTLPTLVAECELPVDNVRQAHPDVRLLEEVGYYHFEKQQFAQNMSSFATEFNMFKKPRCQLGLQ